MSENKNVLPLLGSGTNHLVLKVGGENYQRQIIFEPGLLLQSLWISEPLTDTRKLCVLEEK